MQLACSRKSNKCLIPGEHMFYFQQMFLNALDGIDTHGITNGVVGIASTILIISFLYGAYQAFSSGGDVRALGFPESNICSWALYSRATRQSSATSTPC